MAEGDRRAAGVQRRGHAVVIERPIDVVLDVLLAGPDHLDRAIDLPGDLHRLGDAVDLQPAAEAAAEQVIVDLDLLQRQAGHLRRRRLGAAQNLRAEPDVAAIRAHMHRAVHRLHGGMRQQRQLIDRLERAGGARHGLGDIAILHGDHAGPLQRLLMQRGQIGAGEIGVGARVPGDVERRQALLRRPHVIGDHRHRIVEAHHLAHALDGLRLAVVEARELAAEHRAGRHRRDLHARKPDVDAELRLAVDLVGSVEALGGLADQLECARILERHVVGHRQLRGRLGERPIGELAPGRRMDHLALLGAAGERIDVPGLGCGRHQHAAGGRAGAAQRLPEGAHRGRAAGRLEAQKLVAIELVVGRRVRDA